MPFSSSEIRWFSPKEKLFRQLFDELPGGNVTAEPVRTDFYLRTDSHQTGVKIREGNHEIKVQSAADEALDFGVMQDWLKWSVPEKNNVLNAVDKEFLIDWVEVRKLRFKKNYDVSDGNPIFKPAGQFLDEGCGIEFTKIELPQFQQSVFTFGLEAFSTQNRCRENLLLTLKSLNVDFCRLQNEQSCGYPQWLSGLL